SLGLFSTGSENGREHDKQHECMSKIGAFHDIPLGIRDWRFDYFIDLMSEYYDWVTAAQRGRIE
ncbi:MAG: hypothetical protein KC421_05390, partial [Anaerolineales bacterium]|nr:hypothetical protein [Anaerolineales bacterium]